MLTVENPTSQSLTDLILSRYQGTAAMNAWGETAIFYNPAQRLPKGVYFATLKDHDGANDRASGLDRPGMFRLNLGLPKPLFVQRFGRVPSRPPKGGVVDGDWDFTTADRIMPHPVYGWMAWIAVLNPSRSTLEELLPLMDAAYAKAVDSFAARTRLRQSMARPVT